METSRDAGGTGAAARCWRKAESGAICASDSLSRLVTPGARYAAGEPRWGVPSVTTVRSRAPTSLCLRTYVATRPPMECPMRSMGSSLSDVSSQSSRRSATRSADRRMHPVPSPKPQRLTLAPNRPRSRCSNGRSPLRSPIQPGRRTIIPAGVCNLRAKIRSANPYIGSLLAPCKHMGACPSKQHQIRGDHHAT